MIQPRGIDPGPGSTAVLKDVAAVVLYRQGLPVKLDPRPHGVEWQTIRFGGRRKHGEYVRGVEKEYGGAGGSHERETVGRACPIALRVDGTFLEDRREVVGPDLPWRGRSAGQGVDLQLGRGGKADGSLIVICSKRFQEGE